VETLLSLALGISLSAASGFRIFVPPLVMSILSHTSFYDPPANLAWMESPLATTAFAIATLLEVSAYYVPWLDHLLDLIATPAAAIAGILMTGAFTAELDPALRWTLAIIAGGGAASGIQMLTNVSRLMSSATTGGLGNPVVATTENAAATGLSLLALFLPLLALAAVIALLWFAISRVLRFRQNRIPRT
jgi:predicted secreted protein